MKLFFIIKSFISREHGELIYLECTFTGKKLVLMLPVVENKRLQITIACFNTMCINKERFLNVILSQNMIANDFDESGASTA